MLAIPFTIHLFDDPYSFVSYLTCLMIIGALSSSVQGSLYAQGGKFPGGAYMAAISLGMGLS